MLRSRPDCERRQDKDMQAVLGFSLTNDPRKMPSMLIDKAMPTFTLASNFTSSSIASTGFILLSTRRSVHMRSSTSGFPRRSSTSRSPSAFARCSSGPELASS